MTTTSSTRPQAVTALREIARALSSAWDLDTTLNLIARKTTEVMLVDSCTIYLLDSDRETLRLRASTGLAKRSLGRATLKIGEGMTGYALKMNRPVYATEAQKDPHFKWLNETSEAGFTSLLAIPLSIGVQQIGALNVQTLTKHIFTEQEIDVLALIGELAAGALAKAQLYDKQRRQIEELRALAQMSEIVTSPQYLGDILDVVTEMAAQTMQTAVCLILLLDDTGEWLKPHSGQQQTPHPSLPVKASMLGQVATSGRPFYIRDVTAAQGYPETEWAQSEGLVSLLAVPLSVRDRVIGVLCAYTAVLRDFPEEQQALFATLANQTALAIENAQLVTNTAIVREMHHRIKNNLQTVIMLMQMQLSDAERFTTRDVLTINIHRIRSIATVHEILSEKGFRLVNVKQVIDRIIQTTAETMHHPQQQIDIHVFGDELLLPSKPATSLALSVNELVQNCLEHAFVNRNEGHIEVSMGRSPTEIIVLVRDNGVGLSDNYTPDLGLEIVTTLVEEDLHGRFKFNRLSNGTEASIRLPRQIERES